MSARQDYMSGKITHEQFYRSVAKAAGISFRNSDMLPRVKAALANGDEHLNTISLKKWDIMAAAARPAISRALKEHGDFFSLAGGVCTMKQAAIQAAEEQS